MLIRSAIEQMKDRLVELSELDLGYPIGSNLSRIPAFKRTASGVFSNSWRTLARRVLYGMRRVKFSRRSQRVFHQTA